MIFDSRLWLAWPLGGGDTGGTGVRMCAVFWCVTVLCCGCAGTASSCNTVVVGQENFPDTDETKLARESEERSVT